MKPWRVGLLASAGTLALVLALTLTGAANGLALLVYILFLATLALAALVGRVRSALPSASDFEKALDASIPSGEIEQLESIRRRLAVAGYSELELYPRFRPLVQEIVAARLYRRYGIQLESEPQKAAALIGHTRAWALVRPDRRPPEDRAARGWSERELTQLVQELESM